MRVLVLGGTRFVGRHIVDALAAGGHQVAVFSRGRSAFQPPAGVERLVGNRDDGRAGLAALERRIWDACVDVSGYTPSQVKASAELLDPVVGRYLFVSTVSVYEDSMHAQILETHPLLAAAGEDATEVTNDTYGPLKVTCEQVVTSIYGPRSTIFRPQIVAGRWDPTGRHTYWVQRAKAGGEMLAPGDGSDHVQVVDARDIARFARVVLEQRVPGIFNLAGPRLTWSAFIDLLRARAPVWVAADILRANKVSFVELPLYLRDRAERSSLMHVSSECAASRGFIARDAGETIADVQAWLAAHPVALALSPEREQELIARAREHQQRR